MKPRILFLVPAEYDALRKKGVDRMIVERDEGGYFERVVTVHPLARARRTIDLDPVHRIYELGIGRGVTAPLRAIAALRVIVRIARAERIDLVRATDVYFMGLLAWWVSRSLDIPFCVSVHADYKKRFALSPKGPARRWLRRVAGVMSPFVLRRAGLVLPIREHLIPSLVAAGARPDAVRVIPHGIAMAPFVEPSPIDARAAFDAPPPAKVISFVGRLTADNYTAEMASVIERVARRRKDVVFVIVGEGPDEQIVRGLLAGPPEVAAAVRLFPFQPYDRVVALRRISTASLCLMAGFSLIEACAAGSPVVAYDVEWHRELVQDGVTGYLLREHDVAGVAAALDRILDDEPRAAAMGERAKQAAFARHDLRHTSQIKRDCYTALLQGRPRSAARS